MIGETAIQGIYVPTLLIMAIAAMVVTLGLIKLANMVGLYRLFAYRALVDLCIFVLVLGLMAWASPLIGLKS